MSLEFEFKGLDKLIKKLTEATREPVIRQSLSLGTMLLAGWSKKNRFVEGGNSKVVHPTMLTSRTGNYQSRIRGQAPSAITKEGNVYIGKYGTDVTHRGFSYPRLHEFGGKFHRPRPVLTPAINEKENQRAILNILTEKVNEALSK